MNLCVVWTVWLLFLGQDHSVSRAYPCNIWHEVQVHLNGTPDHCKAPYYYHQHVLGKHRKPDNLKETHMDIGRNLQLAKVTQSQDWSVDPGAVRTISHADNFSKNPSFPFPSPSPNCPSMGKQKYQIEAKYFQVQSLWGQSLCFLHQRKCSLHWWQDFCNVKSLSRVSNRFSLTFLDLLKSKNCPEGLLKTGTKWKTTSSMN